MHLSRVMLARRFYADLDYMRHFPKAYMEKTRRHVPLKTYDNRFGAPPVIRWAIPPDDHMPNEEAKRSWEEPNVNRMLRREMEHQEKLFSKQFFAKRVNKRPMIPPEKWTIFPGDKVEVMVGKDKGRWGIVSHVVREENAVFVEGLHNELQDRMSGKSGKASERLFGESASLYRYAWQERPLYVDKGEVQLRDPHDDQACQAKWVLNDKKTEYERVSMRTGFRIPLPSRAFSTYEYMTPHSYLEVEGKDTPADVVLKRSYVPKLCTFEEEIEQELGLEKTSKAERPPTYWY